MTELFSFEQGGVVKVGCQWDQCGLEKAAAAFIVKHGGSDTSIVLIACVEHSKAIHKWILEHAGSALLIHDSQVSDFLHGLQESKP